MLTEQDREFIVFVHRNGGLCISADIQRIYNLDIHADDKRNNFCAGQCPFKKDRHYSRCTTSALTKVASALIQENPELFIEYLL